MNLPLCRISRRFKGHDLGDFALADPWADTTTPQGRLVTTMIAGFAEFERELILNRTNEGRKRAMARGVKMGPRFKLTPFQRAEALQALADDPAVTTRDLAQRYGVSHSTIVRLRA